MERNKVKKENFKSYKAFVKHYFPEIKLFTLSDSQLNYLQACFIQLKYSHDLIKVFPSDELLLRYGCDNELMKAFTLLPPKNADFTAIDEFFEQCHKHSYSFKKLSDNDKQRLKNAINKVIFQFEFDNVHYSYINAEYIVILRNLYLFDKEKFNQLCQKYTKENRFYLYGFYEYVLNQIEYVPDDYEASKYKIFLNRIKYPFLLDVERFTAIYQYYKNQGYNNTIIEGIIKYKYPYYSIQLINILIKNGSFRFNNRYYTIFEYYLYYLAKFPYEYEFCPTPMYPFVYNKEILFTYQEIIHKINQIFLDPSIKIEKVRINSDTFLNSDLKNLVDIYSHLQ